MTAVLYLALPGDSLAIRSPAPKKPWLYRSLDRLCDQLERLVTAIMTEAIVDRLEMVGFDDQQRTGTGRLLLRV
jgi:hypothetical protein